MQLRPYLFALVLMAGISAASLPTRAADLEKTCVTVNRESCRNYVGLPGANESCLCTKRFVSSNEGCAANETEIGNLSSFISCQYPTSPNEAQERTTVTSLTPKLQIPIAPNFQFSKILIKDVEEGGETVLYGYIPYLGEYFAMLYKYLIGVAAILAGVMITVGGFEWLMARGDGGKIKQAKSRITSAVLGLLLALGSYTILYLINPELVTFENIKIKLVQEEPLTIDDSPDEVEDSVNPIDQRISFSRGTGCNKAGIQSSAEDLVNIPTCIGPNHCVWFVNRVLNTAGCTVNQNNVAHGPTLKNFLLQNRWQQVTGDLKSNLTVMKNIAVIRRSAHYALVVRTGSGNTPSDFLCYESNYTRPAQEVMRKFGGANCTVTSRGTECTACERFQFEGPSPDTSGGYWARKYTRRYGNSGPNQAFIKSKGLCGTSDEFFILPE